MTNFILYTLTGACVYIYYFYCWNKLAHKKINYKNYKIYLSLFIFIVFGSLITLVFPPFIKAIIITVLVMAFANFMVFKNLRESLAATILVQATMMICEAVYVVILQTFFSINAMDFVKLPLGIIITNIGVPLLCSLTMLFDFTYKVYELILRIVIKLNKNKLIKYSFSMLFFAIVLTSAVYMDLSIQQIMLINTSMVIFYIWLSGRIKTSEIKYEDADYKYKTSREQLENIEKELDEYKLKNHEMKNTLKMIEDMVKRNDEETLKFIENLKQQDKRCKSVKAELAYKVPLPGLKSLIHDKLLEMEEKSIKYSIYISREVKASKLLNILDNEILSICQIVGVYLDNAIQEVETMNKRNVKLEFYIEDNNFCILVSNNYKTKIMIDEISNEGYTTKGKNHGYGLSLVKKLVEKNKKFSTNTELKKQSFTQILKIKM